MVKIVIGKREIFVESQNDTNQDIFRCFSSFLNLKKEYIEKIMEECCVPKQVVISFLKNNEKENTAGEYIINNQEIIEQIVQIFLYPNIYNNSWDLESKGNNFPIMLEVVHTFIHEIVHHKYLNERKDSKRAREYVASIFPELLEDLNTILALDTTGHLLTQTI